MWLAGAGVVSYPSDGRERVVANHLAILATGSGPAAHCPNAAPRGYLDAATCESIRGWARDDDAPASSIDVHLYVGGPAGDPAAIGVPIRADRARDDLCAALGRCEHGFEMPVPHGLMDGIERPVFAYGIDAMGGPNTLLTGSPMALRCDPPALPFDRRTGILRHVASPEILAAWRFQAHDAITLDDAELATFDEGDPLPSAPRLVATDGDPRVFLADGDVRRHVPDPAAMDAWRFAWGAIETLDGVAIGALEIGDPITPRPWLVRGSGPAIYLLDSAMRVEEPDAGVAVRDASTPVRGTDAGRARDRHLDGSMSCAASPGRGPLVWLALIALIALALRGERSRRPRERAE